MANALRRRFSFCKVTSALTLCLEVIKYASTVDLLIALICFCVSQIGFRTQMLNAVKDFSKSNQNGLFINSCFAHCQSERQDTWFADDSPLIGSQVQLLYPILASSLDEYTKHSCITQVKQRTTHYSCYSLSMLMGSQLRLLLGIGTLIEQWWRPSIVRTLATTPATTLFSNDGTIQRS